MMNISDAEARVMAVLWASAPLSSGQVVACLSNEENWSPKTIRTLLDRLHAKGALARELPDRVYLYRPLISHQQWLQTQATALVETHFNGRLAPLVSAFASSQPLSDRDREEILAILEGKNS